jgi:hypothetical protein
MLLWGRNKFSFQSSFVFLNCTKNIELTRTDFTRTFGCTLTKKTTRRAIATSVFEIIKARKSFGSSAMKSLEWKTYRTRFLVKAKQLNSNFSFVDALGRQHSGRRGDYLVESSDGVISITPRRIFEDIYVPILGDEGLRQSCAESISRPSRKVAQPFRSQRTPEATLALLS